MRLIHQDATARTLLGFTRLVFGIWLVEYLLLPFEEVAYLPFRYCDPVGVLRLVPKSMVHQLCDLQLLLALRCLLVVCCLGCLLRRWPLMCSTLVCLLVTVAQSLTRSFGHTNHAEITLILATYILTAFSLAEAFRRDRNAKLPRGYNPYAVPLITTAMVICVTYTLVAATRFTRGTHEIFLGNSVSYFVRYLTHEPSVVSLGIGQRIHEWPGMVTVAKIVFLAVTVVELCAPWCLVQRGFRMVFLVVILGFHLGVLLLLHLPFIESLLLMAFLIDFSARRTDV